MTDGNEKANAASRDFVREIVAMDVAAGVNGGKVVTRFPPEPNGYLHIGHAKAICVDFGVAADFGGYCNLRFDDTNPVKEDVEYVESIKDDVRWLGFQWHDREYYASDYYERLYEFAKRLIQGGHAYVDSLSADQMREYRGTLTEPGRPSPHRDRGVDENLDLFRRMRSGEFPDGAHVLRAKIDMASPNINLRDPALYRFGTRNITARARRGASTRCTTTRIRSRTPSKESRTRSARSNTRITARSTTGACRWPARRISRDRSNSRGSI